MRFPLLGSAFRFVLDLVLKLSCLCSCFSRCRLSCALSAMKAGVLTGRVNFKVFRPIIISNMINMMDLFILAETPAQSLFRNQVGALDVSIVGGSGVRRLSDIDIALLTFGRTPTPVTVGRSYSRKGLVGAFG